MFRVVVFIFIFFGLTVSSLAQEVDKKRTIFDLPSMLARHRQLQLEFNDLFKSRDYSAAADKCRDAIELFPEEPNNYYFLAVCLSRLGKPEDSFSNLEKAVDLGFSNIDHIQQNTGLIHLSKSEKFDELTKRALNSKRKKSSWLMRSVLPSPFDDRIALVSDSNTIFNLRLGVFESSFKLQNTGPRLGGLPVTTQKTKIGTTVRRWFMKGTCAGLKNHLYDNHDGDHSNMRHQIFPQLKLVEFCDEAKQYKLNHGLQVNFFYNAVTIGNASEAIRLKGYERSLPRLAYTSPRNIGLLYRQYTGNHLYVYPEHNDHDSNRSDRFASNTPYVLISQGSSGSDRKLLEAVAWTLASFQPQTKKKLIKGDALMPAVQMVFRRTNQRVQSVQDYLSGKAHPTVFDGKTIDEWRLINLAHGITPDEVPPVAELSVTEEDEPELGIDYFDDRPRVKLYDTPAAIARLLKSTKQTYRMVVSAEKSHDLNDRPLTYHWRVLRGDPEHIRINPLNADRSIVEIIVSHQKQRPIEPGSSIMSTRVDIGAFVHNGAYYSAPAFVSLHSPRNEIRTYNAHSNIASVAYTATKNPYEDPILTIPRTWTDSYQYDEKQRLIGWTRTRKAAVEQFTAQGALVTEKDNLGRPLKAQTVRYQRSTAPKQILPTLEQHLGEDELHYQYESPQDKIGRIIKRIPTVRN